MDGADVLTLKYAYGMAAVSTGIHKVFHPYFGNSIRADTNRAVQAQKMTRGWKF